MLQAYLECRCGGRVGHGKTGKGKTERFDPDGLPEPEKLLAPVFKAMCRLWYTQVVVKGVGVLGYVMRLRSSIHSYHLQSEPENRRLSKLPACTRIHNNSFARTTLLATLLLMRLGQQH